MCKMSSITQRGCDFYAGRARTVGLLTLSSLSRNVRLDLSQIEYVFHCVITLSRNMVGCKKASRSVRLQCFRHFGSFVHLSPQACLDFTESSKSRIEKASLSWQRTPHIVPSSGQFVGLRCDVHPKSNSRNLGTALST